MKRLFVIGLAITILCSFRQIVSLKGTWEYAGDIYNGKREAAPAAYSLQRRYDDTSYSAYLLEKGSDPEKYESGNYLLTADTCYETQLWSEQPSKLLNITLHYQYKISNDTLILSGILPNGNTVTEYWKKAK